LVDFYGARATGSFVAFGLARSDRAPSAEGDPRVETGELGIIDIRSHELRVLAAVKAGWWISAVAGSQGWLVVRERRQEPASACADNADCWSWALHAYHLPDVQPLLLASSLTPESQTHMPEPRCEGLTFAWLQGGGAGKPMLVKSWTAGGGAPPRELGAVEDATMSPFLSVSGGRVWLDQRDPAGGTPKLRAIDLSDGRSSLLAFDTLAFAPAVSGDQTAFVTADPARQEDDPAQRRVVQLARTDLAGGHLTADKTLTSADDIWDLAWLDGRRLVVAGSQGIEVLDPARSVPRLALLADETATAARVGDGRLVTVKSEEGRDVVRRYRVAE